MKKLAGILVLVISLNAFAEDPTEDKFDLTRTDKQLHVFASYGLAYTSIDAFRRANYTKTQSYAYGALLTLAVGALKEGTDKEEFSTNDMLANGVGVITALAFNLTFDWIFDRNKTGVKSVEPAR